MIREFKAILLVFTLSAIATTSYGMSVWVVESGADPFASSGSILYLSPGTTVLDLYYDLEGDTSYGYDFNLSITGIGSITNVMGGDSGLGASTSDGWRQFGGDIYGESGHSVLAFTFDFYSAVGAQLVLDGSYTDSSFADSHIEEVLLAQTSAPVSQVPIPSFVLLILALMLSWLGIKAIRVLN